MRLLALILAHTLGLVAALVAAFGAFMLLARMANRLTRWRSATGGSEFMFSTPIGGFGWLLSSAVVRSIAAFGTARLVFWLLSVQPTLYFTVALVLIFAIWDTHQFRLATHPPLRPPASTISVLRFKIAAGFVASIVAATLFLGV